MINTKKYDIIYSLGSNCACALYLNKNNLRATSGPFDWIDGITFKDRINFILNDFNDWLNPNNLKKNTPKDDHLKHERYVDSKYNCIFPHDFTLNETLKSSYPKVKEKYLRRINRFYNNLTTKNNILLIWFSLDFKVSKSEIKWASDKLNKKFNKNINIVIIEHNDTLLNKDMLIQQITPSSIKISLFAKNINETAEFTKGNTKLCNKIFKKYILKRPITQQVKIFIIKTFCNLIPNKNLRKKMRSILLFGQTS